MPESTKTVDLKGLQQAAHVIQNYKALKLEHEQTHPEHVTALDAHPLEGGVGGNAGAKQRSHRREVHLREALRHLDDKVSVDHDGAAVPAIGAVTLGRCEEYAVYVCVSMRARRARLDTFSATWSCLNVSL